jgi:hypothetical protein
VPGLAAGHARLVERAAGVHRPGQQVRRRDAQRQGRPEDQIAMAVQKYGVCKVNIDTDLRLAMTAKIREVFATKPAEFDRAITSAPRARRSRKMVQRKLHVLNSAGKSEAVITHWEKLGRPLPTYYTKGKAA